MAERLPEPVVPLFPRFRLPRTAMKLQKKRKHVLRKNCKRGGRSAFRSKETEKKHVLGLRQPETKPRQEAKPKSPPRIGEATSTARSKYHCLRAAGSPKRPPRPARHWRVVFTLVATEEPPGDRERAGEPTCVSTSSSGTLQ